MGRGECNVDADTENMDPGVKYHGNMAGSCCRALWRQCVIFIGAAGGSLVSWSIMDMSPANL